MRENEERIFEIILSTLYSLLLASLFVFVLFMLYIIKHMYKSTDANVIALLSWNNLPFGNMFGLVSCVFQFWWRVPGHTGALQIMFGCRSDSSCVLISMGLLSRCFCCPCARTRPLGCALKKPSKHVYTYCNARCFKHTHTKATTKLACVPCGLTTGSCLESHFKSVWGPMYSEIMMSISCF